VTQAAAVLSNGGQSTDASGGDAGDQAHDSAAPAGPDAARPEPATPGAAQVLQSAVAGADGTPAAASPQATSTHVAHQIARQAELFRAPGTHGVRIQLNPDDLGGVDVTLRYSAASGVQLHINVEHASTGELVHAGWNDLRDALAGQGITPERLIMSVSGPTDTRGGDFANGSSRSDQGFAGFGQTGSGDQRQQGESHRSTRTWSGLAAPATTDDSPQRPSPSQSGSGRIDYRV
jgi:flagellar hook-length control protein FliK